MGVAAMLVPRKLQAWRQEAERTDLSLALVQVSCRLVVQSCYHTRDWFAFVTWIVYPSDAACPCKGMPLAPVVECNWHLVCGVLLSHCNDPKVAPRRCHKRVM